MANTMDIKKMIKIGGLVIGLTFTAVNRSSAEEISTEKIENEGKDVDFTILEALRNF